MEYAGHFSASSLPLAGRLCQHGKCQKAMPKLATILKVYARHCSFIAKKQAKRTGVDMLPYLAPSLRNRCATREKLALSRRAYANDIRLYVSP